MIRLIITLSLLWCSFVGAVETDSLNNIQYIAVYESVGPSVPGFSKEYLILNGLTGYFTIQYVCLTTVQDGILIGKWYIDGDFIYLQPLKELAEDGDSIYIQPILRERLAMNNLPVPEESGQRYSKYIIRDNLLMLDGTSPQLLGSNYVSTGEKDVYQLITPTILWNQPELKKRLPKWNKDM